MTRAAISWSLRVMTGERAASASALTSAFRVNVKANLTAGRLPAAPLLAIRVADECERFYRRVHGERVAFLAVTGEACGAGISP